MTQEETNKIDLQIEILQAYKEGKTIQYLDSGDTWTEAKHNNYKFDFINMNYRIKPEPKYHPYQSAKELLEDIKEKGLIIKLKHQEDMYFSIVEFNNYGIGTVDWEEIYLKAYESCLWLDGTPFGRKEGEDE